MPDFGLLELSDSPFRILDDGRFQVKLEKLTQYHGSELHVYDFLIKNDEGADRSRIGWKIYIGRPNQSLEGEIWIINI